MIFHKPDEVLARDEALDADMCRTIRSATLKLSAIWVHIHGPIEIIGFRWMLVEHSALVAQGAAIPYGTIQPCHVIQGNRTFLRTAKLSRDTLSPALIQIFLHIVQLLHAVHLSESTSAGPEIFGSTFGELYQTCGANLIGL